jgi:4-hydroxy-tetrahydrodipicolinate synthase
MKIEGSFVALVTPFSGGSVDLEKVRELVEFHLANGTQGICPVATTGESPVLNHEEKASIIDTVVKAARGKALVFPGTGTNDTKSSVELTKMAHELGADGALVVTPYYNKPSQEGLYRHYEAVAKASPNPVILYNVPGRTGVSLAPETTARLSAIKNIAALKDASGSVEQVTRVRNLCDIRVLSGEETLTYAILCHGGVGVISVAANIAPRVIFNLCDAVRRGDHAAALKLHERHYGLFKALFLETNPVPVKTAMKMMGKLNGETRLPLCEMSPANAETLERELKICKLL